MARINSHLGSKRRTRLTLYSNPSPKSVAEHQGRLPQPGVPSGSRNTPSASAHYHGDLSIPGYDPATPTVAPPAGEAATGPAGDYPGAGRAYRRAVKAIPPPIPTPFTPTPTLASLGRPQLSALGSALGGALNPANALQALLAGVSGLASAPDQGGDLLSAYDEPFTKAQLHPNEDQVGEKEGQGVAPIGRDILAKYRHDIEHSPSLSPGQRQGYLRSADMGDAGYKQWLAEHQPTAPSAPTGRPADPATAVFASAGSPHAPVDPADPLGAKTLGDVTAAQLAHAQQQGTLQIGPNGVLTTPAPRQARQQLIAARRRFAQTNGIQELSLGPDATAFADALAQETHFDPQGVGAWVLSEGGAYENGGSAGPQNWLGVGYPGHQTPFGTGPHFSGSPAEAGRATGQWIKGEIGASEGYPAAPGIQAMLPAAAHGSAQDLLGALQASGWGTDVSHVQANLASVQVSHDPQAAQALAVAKQRARAVGINPTPFNGDVEGGGGDKLVWIRAGADGMVDWATSAIGTQEGTPKQQRWAANQGLGSSQPWCANFISNGLKRRGIEPPPNPNFVPSYETEWKGGTNIGTDLSKAKPGDLIAFSGQHIGLYVGNGEMISGNFGDEVSRDPISADSSAVSMILRPHYKGGRIQVKVGQAVPGSTSESTFGGSGEGGSVAGAAPAAAPASTGRAAPAELVALQSPLAAGPVLPDAYLGTPDEHAESAAQTLQQLLGEPAGSPGILSSGRRPVLS